MIVITSLETRPREVAPGDQFTMTISDNMGCDVIVNEEITVYKTIDFIASFRFALEDGTCPGFHLTGIFANKNELPAEIQNAVMFEDLTPEQKENFINSVGIKLKKKQRSEDDSLPEPKGGKHLVDRKCNRCGKPINNQEEFIEVNGMFWHSGCVWHINIAPISKFIFKIWRNILVKINSWAKK